MCILVKNVNGRLIFVLDEHSNYEQLMLDLKGLLEKSFFKHKDYFPKAFFDFQSRIINEDEIIALFDVLMKTQCVLFGGYVDKIEQEKHIQLIDCSLHGGEIYTINEDSLITGKINPGAIVYLNASLYVLQGVYGIVEGTGVDAQIISKEFKGATIRFFNRSLHDFTSFTMTNIYYKDDEIICDREDYINV